MRILMITDFYWPFLGGVEQHVRTLSHTLVEMGHSVAVATLCSDGMAAEETDAGVRIYRLRATTQRAAWLYSRPQRAWAPPFPDPEITWGLRRVLRLEEPEILHGHDWLARSFLPLKRTANAKLVVSLHYYTRSCAKKNLMFHGTPCAGPSPRKCLACAADHYGAGKGSLTTLANWAMSAAERSAVDLYIAVSRATAEGNGLCGNASSRHSPGRGSPSLRVIPNFLPGSAAHSPPSPEPYLSQLPEGEFLMFVGDLRPMKGLDVLLRAYSALRERLPGAPPLVLIGKVWPDTPTDLPPNTLVFREWPNAAVLEAWKRSLIGLLPSRWPEPFGIVVIEAMAGGAPVIASRIGGIPEIVADGVHGLLVEPGDCDALSRAMQRLIEDAPLRRTMGEAARRRAADFQAPVVVRDIEAAYRQVLAQ